MRARLCRAARGCLEGGAGGMPGQGMGGGPPQGMGGGPQPPAGGGGRDGGHAWSGWRAATRRRRRRHGWSGWKAAGARDGRAAASRMQQPPQVCSSLVKVCSSHRRLRHACSGNRKEWEEGRRSNSSSRLVLCRRGHSRRLNKQPRKGCSRRRHQLRLPLRRPALRRLRRRLRRLLLLLRQAGSNLPHRGRPSWRPTVTRRTAM